jgi:hypothetical protein
MTSRRNFKPGSEYITAWTARQIFRAPAPVTTSLLFKPRKWRRNLTFSVVIPIFLRPVLAIFVGDAATL